MRTALQGIRSAAAGLLIVLAACGGGGGDDDAEVPPVSAVIGSAGGTLTGPSAAKVEIPPGALGGNTSIAIAQTSSGSPPMPGGLLRVGAMFAFTPHGTTFAMPVTVTLPFDPALLPAGATPVLYKTNARDQWEQVIGAVFDAGTVTAPFTGFSYTTVAIPPVQRNEPTREWSFEVVSGGGVGTTPLPPPDGMGVQTGGTLDRHITFGPAVLDTKVLKDGVEVPPDGLADGAIFSSPDGSTYGAFVETPFAPVTSTRPIGGAANLRQTQTFIKRANNATLSFTVTNVLLRAIDFQRRSEEDDLMSPNIAARSIFSVRAFHGQEVSPDLEPGRAGSNFYFADGYALVFGSGSVWTPRAGDYFSSRNSLWTKESFELVTAPAFMAPDGSIVSEPVAGGCQGFSAVFRLLQTPKTYHIDLSSVPLHGKFALYITAELSAHNERGGGSLGDCEGSSASSFLRDPLEVGGATLAFEGLEPTNEVPPPEPASAFLVEPAACTSLPSPDPAAGSLQFAAASFRISERPGLLQEVLVTRSGGSKGAVTATFATSDGSAVAGTDYTPVRATVFFADGDSAPRLVDVPIIGNNQDAPDKTVNLTLSQPGGCAALGPIASAVLTIVDDDEPPPLTLPTGIDTTFGNAGKATLDHFGGQRSGMALQADGKIVMVGGSFFDFILARFNADGSLDRSFGIEGKVATDMGSGLRQEEALAVAVQADGKIVVAGYTGIDLPAPAQDPPSTFAIARYHSDGSLDASFGNGGRVSGNVNGIARAVSIQPDGKIVLAGDVVFFTGGLTVSDLVVARFNPNGSLDLAFGGSGTGQVTTDVGNAGNSGSNLLLQPDGRIVVSGLSVCEPAGCQQTDVVRYNANGSLDTGFGTGGKVTLPAVDVGQGLARQGDGKLVLAGTVVQPIAPATSRMVLMRLRSDGSLDTAFGTGGTAGVALTENARAGGVALQADGKIVVVGTRVLAPNANFVVARYHVDGTLDTGFGNAGALSIDFFGFTDIGENVIVQPDGRILVGGNAENDFDGYGLTRINP